MEDEEQSQVLLIQVDMLLNANMHGQMCTRKLYIFLAHHDIEKSYFLPVREMIISLRHARKIIYHLCKVWIDEFVPHVTVWHHLASLEIPN